MTSRRAATAEAARRAVPAVLVVLLVLAVPRMGVAQESRWRYDHDVHLTYEFDDNVEELTEDPARSQVARLSYRGDVRWGGGRERLTVTYQGGFKRHFGFTGPPSFDISSQFVNEGKASYLRRITDRLALGGNLLVKNRTWTSDDFFLNEDGFTRWSGGVDGVVNLAPGDGTESVRVDFGARYGDIEFDNLDQAFGNHSVGGYLGVRKRFDEDLEVRWTYSFDRIRYPGRGTLTPEDRGDAKVILSGRTRERQEDDVHELGTEVEWFGPVGVLAEYTFRLNDSNSFGFSYLSHNFGLQLLRPLPWGMLAQVYGLVELRDFGEPVPSFTGGGQLDTGDSANNALLLRVVKDLNPDYSVELRYGRYRSESITLNDFFTKNIYSLGITYRP